jgi:hypothetical protein
LIQPDARRYPVNPLDADFASIATGIVAVVAYCGYRYSRSKRRWRLEGHLRDTLSSQAGQERAGEVNVPVLMAELGMTEAEILEAAFRSRKVKRVVRPDLYLKYQG